MRRSRERRGPVDWQYDPRPPAPSAPEGAGRPARRGSPPAASLLLCAVGALLVAVGAALVHLAPPVATAVTVTLPAAEPAPVRAVVVPAPPPPAPSPRPTATVKARAKTAVPPPKDPEAAPPRSLQVKAAGIDTPLIALDRLRDGTLEVPEDFDVAGWYRDGVKPGDRGPAVLVGHVDSYTGPAVFFGVKDLRRDDEIVVTRTDGTKVVFAVYDRETVQKDEFPTSRVYGDTDGPELRLVTCGGPFDAEIGHYRDNVVVYAKQVRRR